MVGTITRDPSLREAIHYATWVPALLGCAAGLMGLKEHDPRGALLQNEAGACLSFGRPNYVQPRPKALWIQRDLVVSPGEDALIPCADER